MIGWRRTSSRSSPLRPGKHLSHPHQAFSATRRLMSNSHGPMVEHLKTPSRTATVKKTRAKLEAEKQRTDKIKSVNARLALGESPRSLNASPVSLSSHSSQRSLPILIEPGSTTVPAIQQFTTTTEDNERRLSLSYQGDEEQTLGWL